MSRIAKYPIPVPKGVEVNIAEGSISVKGPLGTIARAADPNVEVKREGDQLVCRPLGNSRHANAMSGTMRALVANMVRIAAAVYTGGVGPASTELAPDLIALDFIWKLGEHGAAGGDPREFLFGRSI